MQKRTRPSTRVKGRVLVKTRGTTQLGRVPQQGGGPALGQVTAVRSRAAYYGEFPFPRLLFEPWAFRKPGTPLIRWRSLAVGLVSRQATRVIAFVYKFHWKSRSFQFAHRELKWSLEGSARLVNPWE